MGLLEEEEMRFYPMKEQRSIFDSQGRTIGFIIVTSEFYTDKLPHAIAKRLDNFILKIRDRIPLWSFHLMAGILSGIPICCVFNYVTRSRGRRIPEWFPAWETETPFWLEYIPCLSCLRKGRFAHREGDIFSPKVEKAWEVK